MSPMVTAALSDLSPTIATNSPTTMTLVCKNARQKKTQVARALAECIHILQSCTEPKIPKGLQVREIDERDPRIGLHGQKGLFATEVLPSFFIVGPYKSWVGTEEDFYTQPISPAQWSLYDAYCYQSVERLISNGQSQPLCYSAYNVELLIDYSDAYWDALRAQNIRINACAKLLATMQFREPCLQCEAERVRLDSAQDADSAAEMWDQQSTAADHCHLTPSRCQSQAQILALSTAGQDVWHAEPGKGKSTARVSGNGVEQTARHSTGKNGAACTGLHWEGDVPRAWQKGNGKHRPGGLVAGVAVSMRRKAMGDAGAYC